MAKIPSQTKQFGQPNNSDLFGNIYYTKNINFDKDGYLQLSPRTVSLINSSTDGDFNIPVAFGRVESAEFKVATVDNPYSIQVNATSGITASRDLDSGGDTPPALTFDSHGKYWQNNWHTTEDQLLTYKNVSSGDWTDTSIALTSGVRHPMESFKNRNTFCIGDGNSVLQINTSYASVSLDLTIPADFEVTKLAYNNNKMGVATKLSDGVSGQNGEAYFFVWAGTTASAGTGWGTGSDFIVDIVPYKSSWVLLTRTGQLKYFNGGGFEALASLPVYFSDRVWGDAINNEAFGDVMTVDGDKIYLNVNNHTEVGGRKGESTLTNAPAGVLCYDPKIGIHHRWSPSISTANRLTVTAGNVNTSTNVLTKTAGTIPATGNPIKYMDSPTDVIGGLKINTEYFVIKKSSTTFQLAETKELAINNVAIDLTSQSGSTSYFLALDLVDYGATYTKRTGGVALTEFPTTAIDTIIFGGEYLRNDTVGNLEHICFPVKEFTNIGYFVTATIPTSKNAVTDTYQKGYIKHRPLRTGESITVKSKTKELDGLPVTTPQYGISCTWADNRTFYTTADFSEVVDNWADDKNMFEAEIISGAGAGQMSQIQNITYDNGVYSVELVDALDGVFSTNVCNVIIENWKELKVETNGDISTFADGTTGIGARYKVIIRGKNVTIQEIEIVNTPHQTT